MKTLRYGMNQTEPVPKGEEFTNWCIAARGAIQPGAVVATSDRPTAGAGRRERRARRSAGSSC